MIYDFKSNKGYGIDAQAAGERLEALRSKNNRLETVDVVSDARNKHSPLHDAFEWDDKKAAHEHRLNTARTIIRSIVVTDNGDDDWEQAFVHVHTSDNENYYQATRISVENPSEWAVVVEAARQAIQVAYGRLEELQIVAEKTNPEHVAKIIAAQQSLLKGSSIIASAHQ